MGITPAQLAARYWGYAAQCLTVAQRKNNAADKVALANMAQAWATLAEQTQHEVAEAGGGNDGPEYIEKAARRVD